MNRAERSDSDGRSVRLRPGEPAFGVLEERARTLERSVYALVGIIAVVPLTIFSVVEWNHLSLRASHHGRHCAKVLERHAGQIDPELLRRDLQTELSDDALGFIRVVGPAGTEILRMGERPFSPKARMSLPATMLPYVELEVGVSDKQLKGDVVRVLGIHVVVALALGLGLYWLPMRALKQAARELAFTKAQLLHIEKLSAFGHLLAGLTHEINNPLGIILSRVRLLTSHPPKDLDPDVMRDLEIVERHGTRIAEIIRSLLAFARRTTFEKHETDLNRIVREVVSLVGSPYSKQGIEIRADLAADLPALHGNCGELQQVFLNLFNNSKDAMPSGGSIGVRTYKENGAIIAEVRDTGAGLSPEAMEHLFEPFFTTKDVGQGTGLGLSLSYGIVKAHGGEIEAETAPEGGAVFRLRLPPLGGAS